MDDEETADAADLPPAYQPSDPIYERAASASPAPDFSFDGAATATADTTTAEPSPNHGLYPSITQEDEDELDALNQDNARLRQEAAMTRHGYVIRHGSGGSTGAEEQHQQPEVEEVDGDKEEEALPAYSEFDPAATATATVTVTTGSPAQPDVAEEEEEDSGDDDNSDDVPSRGAAAPYDYSDLQYQMDEADDDARPMPLSVYVSDDYADIENQLQRLEEEQRLLMASSSSSSSVNTSDGDGDDDDGGRRATTGRGEDAVATATRDDLVADQEDDNQENDNNNDDDETIEEIVVPPAPAPTPARSSHWGKFWRHVDEQPWTQRARAMCQRLVVRPLDARYPACMERARDWYRRTRASLQPHEQEFREFVRENVEPGFNDLYDAIVDAHARTRARHS